MTETSFVIFGHLHIKFWKMIRNVNMTLTQSAENFQKSWKCLENTLNSSGNCCGFFLGILLFIYTGYDMSACGYKFVSSQWHEVFSICYIIPENIHTPPREGFFILQPPNLAFKMPLPVGISNDLPWGGCGFFFWNYTMYIRYRKHLLSSFMIFYFLHFRETSILQSFLRFMSPVSSEKHSQSL